MLTGIVPDKEKNVTELAEKMVEGQLTDLKPGEFGIVLGEELADHLGALPGDKNYGSDYANVTVSCRCHSPL